MSENNERLFQTSMIELGVLAVLILVMVVSIYLLRRAHEVVPAEGPPHSGPAKSQPEGD